MHDVVRELFQALRARAEGTQGGFCVDQHVLGELAGVGEAEQAHVGRLVVFGVLAGRLAEGRGVGGGIRMSSTTWKSRPTTLA